MASINGRQAEANGQSILEAAIDMGISIPTICHADGLTPSGGCRMCLVHVEGEDLPVAACHTPLEPGMEIQSHHISVEKLRQEVLKLYFSTGKMKPDQMRPGPFSEMASLYDVMHYDFDKTRARLYDESHPFLWFSKDACINCRLCVSTCEQIEGKFVYGIENRGGASEIIAGPTEFFVDSDCSGCGACVDVCPTNAVFDADRRLARINGDEEVATTTESVCGLCSVGCRIEISAVNLLEISTIRGVPDAEVNRGHLCEKGQYGHRYIDGFDRLTHPMVRSGAGFQRITWPEAIGIIASRLPGILNRDGASAVGGLIGGRVTTEAAFLFSALFRNILGSANVNAWLGPCRENRVPPELRADFSKVEETDLFIIIGANPIVTHPVLGARIKQAVLRGATLIVIDPRRTEMAEYANVHWEVRPGNDQLVWEKILAAQMEPDGMHDPRAQQVARLLSESQTPLVVIGANADVQILPAVMDTLGDRATEGFLPLLGQANARGVSDVVSAFADGLKAEEMLAASSGLKALWLVGCDPLHTSRNTEETKQTFANTEFLIVQDIFLTETAKQADLLLPAAGPLEQDGTMVNSEGRLQQLRRVVVPLERARPDWFVFTQVAEMLGVTWPYQDAGHILNDLAQSLPHLFPGVEQTDVAFHRPDGVMLPKPPFMQPQSSDAEGGKPDSNPDFPYLLCPQRLPEFINAGSFTRRTTRADNRAGDLLTIHPVDAERENFVDGEKIVIEGSNGGKALGVVEISDRVPQGMLFLSNHFPLTQAGSLGLGIRRQVIVRLSKVEPFVLDTEISSDIAELIDIHKRYREETGDAGYESGESHPEGSAPAGVAENYAAE